MIPAEQGMKAEMLMECEGGFLFGGGKSLCSAACHCRGGRMDGAGWVGRLVGCWLVGELADLVLAGVGAAVLQMKWGLGTAVEIWGRSKVRGAGSL